MRIVNGILLTVALALLGVAAILGAWEKTRDMAYRVGMYGLVSLLLTMVVNVLAYALT